MDKNFDQRLFEEITNITKAQGYDILSKRVGRLENSLKEIKEAINDEEIQSLRHKSIFSDLDKLVNKIENIITLSYLP